MTNSIKIRNSLEKLFRKYGVENCVLLDETTDYVIKQKKETAKILREHIYKKRKKR